ncbi:MAG: hypothetical protein ISS15_18645 [Alphaproteobacteria bacterium]|nr:hypothetical protein [Alphaproteobacteria bacterium]MBL7099681.1 hypothetical protein [Alphaproteobacteria bacterium]
MAQSVHYEVFSRKGAKGGWTMIDVCNERQSAIDFAQSLMANDQATGVKVVKETYNDETGDFLSLKILEDGHNRMKLAPAQEDAPHALPCFKPEDLYSYHARATMMRLIPDFLARNLVTISELSVRADLLEKLEATGTLLQHAIQKVAVAQASSTSQPVQSIIKSLLELVTKAFNRVYRDERNNVFPHVKPGAFGPLATRLAEQPDGAYVLNGAIARHLKDAKGWDDKVFRLLELTGEVPADGKGALLLLGSVDAMIAEVLAGSAALHELIGAKEDLGQALTSLVLLFLGQEPADGQNRAGLLALTKHFADDDMPEARTAIANRIMAEFRSSKRLCPNSLEDEFRTLRRIANRVVLGVGKYMSHEDLVAAFTLRSRRLVTHETLGQYMDGAAPDEKLERLLFVEDNVIGIENKRHLGTFVLPLVTAANFETHFLNAKTPPLARIQRLAQLQARLRRTGLPDAQRQELANHLDRIANLVEIRAKVLESIEGKPTSAADKATTVLRLMTGNMLTEGKLSARARDMVVGYLGRPGFLTGYIAQAANQGNPAPSPDAAMATLMETLGKAGINAETGLRSIAA